MQIGSRISGGIGAALSSPLLMRVPTLLALSLCVSCAGRPASDDPTEGEGEDEGETTTTTTTTISINEAMSQNQQTVADDDGDFDDWIELVNSGDDDVDLGPFAMADGTSPPASFVAGAVVPARGFLLVFADDDDDGGTPAEPHLPFKLAGAGEVLVLSAYGLEVDRVVPPALDDDESAGRLGDGGAFVSLPIPTPGGPNSDEAEAPCVPTSTTSVHLSAIRAPEIELRNEGDIAVSLAGLFLADNAAGVGRWPLPDQDVAAGDVVVVTADFVTRAGPLHAGFLLTNGDALVALFDHCGTELERMELP
jgi:hypothetical protein